MIRGEEEKCGDENYRKIEEGGGESVKERPGRRDGKRRERREDEKEIQDVGWKRNEKRKI